MLHFQRYLASLIIVAVGLAPTVSRAVVGGGSSAESSFQGTQSSYQQNLLELQAEIGRAQERINVMQRQLQDLLPNVVEFAPSFPLVIQEVEKSKLEVQQQKQKVQTGAQIAETELKILNINNDLPNLQNILNNLFDRFTELINGLLGNLQGLLENIIGNLPQVLQDLISNLFGQSVGDFQSLVKNLLEQLGGLENLSPEALSALLQDQIDTTLGDFRTQLESAGENIPEAIISQLEDLLAQQLEGVADGLVGQARELASGGVLPEGCFAFEDNLRLGDSGDAVAALQALLGLEGFNIAGPELQPQFFGNSTFAAVVGFQELFSEQILAPLGLTRGTGFVGPSTRAFLNERYACSEGTTTAPAQPVPTVSESLTTTPAIPITPAAPAAVQIKPETVPAARVGTFYAAGFAATVLSVGADYAWEIADGTLPPGLSLLGGISCVVLPCAAISGIPTAAGTYAFTLNVSGSGGSAEQAYTMAVAE